MKTKLLISIFLGLFLIACVPKPLPDTPFESSYSIADFKLNNNYDYWEIRLDLLNESIDASFSLLAHFDPENGTSLNEEQKAILKTLSSNNGFALKCLPLGCPIYGVAIHDLNSLIIDSTASLIDFFDNIDTEAELFVLTSFAQNYHIKTKPISYEEVDDGYLVVLEWDTLCQLRGVDLVKVYKNGVIEKVREISHEKYDTCV